MRRRVTAAVCAALIGLFIAAALWGARHRSATYDEPMHSVAGYVLTRHGDFRANPEDPNLWQRWATLAQPHDALKLNFDDPNWPRILENEAVRWRWCVETLYATPGNDADAFLWRMRCMLVLLGAAAAALVAWWGWQLGGVVAAVVAAALFCCDPNLLAHATQIKNDVALTLVYLAVSLSLWRAGRRLTWGNGIAVALAMAAAPATKFSGVAVVGVAILILVIRAVMPRPWPAFGRELDTRRKRLTAAAGVALAGCLATIALLWACYDFRFGPSPRPTDPLLDVDVVAQQVAIAEVKRRHPDEGFSRAEIEAWRPGPLLGLVFLAHQTRVLPQTWLLGLLHTYASAQVRSSYLCGAYSQTGFTWYFPLAFLFKTPVATILAIFAGLLTAAAPLAGYVRRRRTNTATAPRADTSTPAAAVPFALDTWTAICLLLPPALYFASAMRANLNIGVRHILPIYPPLFVLAGWAASRAVVRWGKRAAWVIAVLLAVVALETGRAAPHFLAFFNTPAGGARGGLRLLGDSNLDWGQDLPALADWQRRHPDRRLDLLYFGTVPPAYYGIRYVPLPGNNPVTTAGGLKPADMPDERGVRAISATHLQGIYLEPALSGAMGAYRQLEPAEVLNGSIYLFDMAAKK